MAARKTLRIMLAAAIAAPFSWIWNAGFAQNDEVGSYVTEISAKNDELGPDKQPIIFWRIKQEDREAVEQLLDAGYDIEKKGGFDATPLIAAALIDDWMTVHMLLERGADPLAADRRGFTMPYLLEKSRVDPNGEFGKAREEVRALLAAKNLGDAAYEPSKVKAMVAEGKWPPH